MQAIDEASKSQPWYTESGSMLRSIAAYPSLQAAIFPPLPTSLTPVQSQDISLYELLQVTIENSVYT
jgi:hypothetical protein